MTDSCTAAPSTAPSRDSVALFAANAGAYAAFRPTYPSALFDWLAQRCGQRERALDIGCGNGQAARALRMQEFKGGQADAAGGAGHDGRLAGKGLRCGNRCRHDGIPYGWFNAGWPSGAPPLR